MRRWNGWGDEATTYPPPDSTAGYPAGLAGEGLHLEEASLAKAVRGVPPTGLSLHPAISSADKDRLFHNPGKSLEK